MKVYVLTTNHKSNNIGAVFSTKEKAEEYIGSRKYYDKSGFKDFIAEVELDEYKPQPPKSLGISGWFYKDKLESYRFNKPKKEGWTFVFDDVPFNRSIVIFSGSVDLLPGESFNAVHERMLKLAEQKYLEWKELNYDFKR